MSATTSCTGTGDALIWLAWMASVALAIVMIGYALVHRRVRGRHLPDGYMALTLTVALLAAVLTVIIIVDVVRLNGQL